MTKLIIVESPTKARTLKKFLGKDFEVESSIGHIRDLPKSKIGVDTESGKFIPEYVFTERGKKTARTLKALAKQADLVILAADPDREGEAIAWHVKEILPKETVIKRATFHEITKTAVAHSLKNLGEINMNLVEAQRARRILDRLVGYKLSPLLWKKIYRGLSAGRVQSVALRLIAEREAEIDAFNPVFWWGIFSELEKDSQKFEATFVQSKAERAKLKTKESADKLLEKISGEKFLVKEIQEKKTKKHPYPPFTTSTLQQSASNRIGFSARKTMSTAQRLYEGASGANGLITYHRTDSFNLSKDFLNSSREMIEARFGKKYLPNSPKYYKTKSKSAQEAHEAIRPTDVSRTPEKMRKLPSDELKLYTMIWERAVSSQMNPAIISKTKVNFEVAGEKFRSSGQRVAFDGFLKVYRSAIGENELPKMKAGDKIDPVKIKITEHQTSPPSRFNEASLIKILEEIGIGRPSTYASIISVIEDRGYVEKESRRFFPTDVGKLVNSFLTKHFSEIVDYKFTAKMESDLDAIAAGEKETDKVLGNFYFPFEKKIKEKEKTITRKDAGFARELGNDPKSGEPIIVRIGRFGPYVQKGDAEDKEKKPKFASLNKGQKTDTITLEEALELFKLPRVLGENDKGEEILANRGRFGPYVKIGKAFYSIKEHDPFTITLEEAIEVIKVGEIEKAKKIIHDFKDSGIQVKKGPYGIYITDGKKNAKIPKDKKPEDLTEEECKELIAKAPAKKKRRFKRSAKRG